MVLEENLLYKIYENIKDALNSNNFKVNNFKKINYGVQFSIIYTNFSGIIRIYQNKKGEIKIDYSLIKSDQFKKRIQKIIVEQRYDSFTEKSLRSLNRFGFPIIGTDEAGKGDYFGSLVGAGVYVDEEKAKKLASIGVKDSKTLSDRQNIELAEKIKNICKYNFSIIEISPPRYNNLYEEFTRENKNLNHLLAWAHAKAIEELLTRVKCSMAIIDQFSDEKFILSKLQERGKKIKIIQMHRAEANIAVAAASILARARFLEKLEELSHTYQIKFPKGSSGVIKVAKEFVNKYGKEMLNQVAKLHFKTTKSIIT